jgi:hypothetical protein
VAVEFILAVVSGLIVTVLSEYLRSKHEGSGTVLEISRHSEVILEERTVVDGEIVQETIVTRIEESTFRLPEHQSPIADRRSPFVAGGLVFIVIIAILFIL